MLTLPISSLPTVNACLNSASAVLLLAGYRFIRRREISRHRACMILAFVCSSAFLFFYIYYHSHVGVVRFTGQGWIRPLYFTLLTTHTILAVAILPLAILTLTRALQERFDRHRRIARWTLPLWLYVSVTGVIIYWLLYRLYEPAMPLLHSVAR
jgi:putative membrane protein